MCLIVFQNAGAQAALQAAQQLMGSMEEPKVVLRVIIEHMLYPVTIDVLKQVNRHTGQANTQSNQYRCTEKATKHSGKRYAQTYFVPYIQGSHAGWEFGK